MDRAVSSQRIPGTSEPAHYSLEGKPYSCHLCLLWLTHANIVVRVEDIQNDAKRGELYVEIKVDGVDHRTGVINTIEDGKPASDAVLTFSQSDSSSIFIISVKQSQKRSSSLFNTFAKRSRRQSQDQLIGYAYIKEDVTKLLQECFPYELRRDLTRTNRSIFRGEHQVTAGTIRLRLDVVDERLRAELWVSKAERSVRDMRTSTEKVFSSNSTIGTIIQAIDQIVEIVDTVAEIHPVLNLSWKVASALYNLVSYQFETDAKLVDMVDKMKEVFRLACETRSLTDRTEALMRSKIKTVLDETSVCSRFVQKYAAHSFAGRLGHWTDSGKICEYATRFADLRKELDSIVIVNVGKGVDNIESQQMLQTLQVQLELSNMELSKVSARPRCLEGTRKDYTDQIMSKLFLDTGSNTDQNIVWLTGAAGTGKSTIAVTISDVCDMKGCPAAYVFFERGKDEYLSAVRAIAYRIAVVHPHVRPCVVEAVKKSSNIVGSPLRTQFEKLLLEPIQSIADGPQHPIVIILDALDECGTSGQREHLVRLLASDFKRLPSSVRVLITSRPESDILKHLSSKSNIHRIELERMSEGSRRDVDIYVREKMIAAVEQGPPKGMEWDGVCRVLSDAADGLFIWASTAVKMVAESNNPRRELRTLLGDIQSVGGGIDSLYATVLEQSGISWHKHEAKGDFEKVLGVVLFAKEALSGEEIEAFLGLEEDTADTVLSRLRSVLVYETGKPVRLHHASFADYLTSDRSSGKPWNIDESVEGLVAERCLDVMIENLRFNICSIGLSFQRNDTVPDLQGRIRRAIPRHLDYACHFWSAHFCKSFHPDSLLEKLKTFVDSKLLYWFEVLSLTKYYNRVAIISLYNTCLKVASIDSDLSSFLWDAYRLASVFAYPISQSVPHIYLSAISLWKGESRIADHYSALHPIVQVKQYGKKAPAQCIKVLTEFVSRVGSVAFSSDGKYIASGSVGRTVRICDADSGEVVSGPFEHADYVNSVAFSPDGRLVASGTDGGTVCVWNVDNGELVLGPLEGHTNWVDSVAFSPNGKYIASGSGDKTIRVWDTESGESVGSPFEGHTGGVNSVVFSHNRKLIASGSSDKTIRVWDAESGRPVVVSGSWDKTVRVWDVDTGKQVIHPIEGHTDKVTSVAFSPNGKCIASGSADKTICIWDTESSELVAGPFLGHSSSVRSVAFSPDGKRTVSGSDDHTIRIWDAESGKPDPDGSEALSGPINSIAFSPDGTRIASGSDDNAIRVWNAENGKLTSGPFKDHTDQVLSIMYSPDGKRIASSSRSGTIRVCDADSGEPVSGPFQGLSNRVRSIAFSPNGKLVAFGSYDGTICVRDVDSGKLVMGPIKGHTGNVVSLSISPDGRFIASSGYSDKPFRVWDVGSGEPVSYQFEGHTGRIYSLTFSPDSRLIASGSEDNTVRVWNAHSGEPLSSPFRAHTDAVRSVVFSPDGRFIASSSYYKPICVWAVENGRLVLGPLEGHSGWVNVAFSPSGKYLASGSSDGTIRVWSLDNIDFEAPSSGGKPSNVTSLDQNSRVDKEHINSNWSLSIYGWVLGPRKELLTWIPEDMRKTLCRARNTNVIGAQFSTRLDLANSPLGEEWCKGYPGSVGGTLEVGRRR